MKRWDHRHCSGGLLRQTRIGRRRRPIATRTPIHLVFKSNKARIGGGFRTLRRFSLANQILNRYASRFYIQIHCVSFQFDHIHLVVRTTRRSNLQSFLRVFAGQVAQQFAQHFPPIDSSQLEDRPTPRLWLSRPFTRIVRGRRAFKVVMNYVALNELEGSGQVPYRSGRFKALLPKERETLRVLLDRWVVTDTRNHLGERRRGGAVFGQVYL